MVAITKRMRSLRPLYYVRHGGEHGQGAATLLPRPAPQITHFDLLIPEQKKAHERATRKQVSGAWSFVRNVLPSLKYHNPSLPIRIQSASAPALNITFESQNQKALQDLTLRNAKTAYISSRFKYSWSEVEPKPKASEETTPPNPSEQIYTRHVKANLSAKPHEEIWEYVEFITQCEEAPEATEQERTMMKEWKDTLSFGGADRVRVKAGMDEIKREKEELKQAREAAERLTTD